MILDVGSGTPNPYHEFLDRPDVIHIDLDRTAYHLDVQCDANHLPFRAKSFDTVYAGHLLEHLTHPFQAVQEFRRVSRRLVIVRVPNASFYKLRPSSPGEHLYSWNEWTLEAFLQKQFQDIRILKARRRLVPKELGKSSRSWHFYLLLEATFFRHDELTAICLVQPKARK